MKLVLDTNKLYSFFWKGSLIKKLLLAEHELYSPEFALEELIKHKSEILSKAKISSKEFDEFISKLKKVVSFIPFSKYEKQFSKALSLLPHHPKDVDFLSLALKLNAGIISQDKELKKQSTIPIFNDSELSKLF
jgi:predicted nucleic acid-binding protein